MLPLRVGTKRGLGWGKASTGQNAELIVGSRFERVGLAGLQDCGRAGLLWVVGLLWDCNKYFS